MSFITDARHVSPVVPVRRFVVVDRHHMEVLCAGRPVGKTEVVNEEGSSVPADVAAQEAGGLDFTYGSVDNRRASGALRPVLYAYLVQVAYFGCL